MDVPFSIDTAGYFADPPRTMGDFSTFLFARPSFTEGLSRILDFGDTLTEYNRSPDDTEADVNAMWSDWLAVGGDLNYAIHNSNVKEPATRVKKLSAT